MPKSNDYATIVPVQIKISTRSLMAVTLTAAVVTAASASLAKVIRKITREVQEEISDRTSQE